VSGRRRYQSKKRQAQSEATRERILEAFAEQLGEPGRTALSPSEAAKAAGVSVRSVHAHFPDHESRVAALAEWFDCRVFPEGFEVASGPEDLPRYFREIHAKAMASPVSRAHCMTLIRWPEVRQARRRERLDAIRKAVAASGAPKRATEDATAILLGLAGADASWRMHDLHGLPLRRVPDAIANTVRLIVDDLRRQARG
jgi:AcrR family transcriptional regulator